MEVLLSFILSVQVGLSVFAVMKYREAISELKIKSQNLATCMKKLLLIEDESKKYHAEMSDIQKDIATLKSKISFGASK